MSEYIDRVQEAIEPRATRGKEQLKTKSRKFILKQASNRKRRSR